MAALRRIGAGRCAIVVAALLAALMALVLGGASGSAAGRPEAAGNRFASERFGYSGRLAAGWHRSARRLVTTISNPLEILSLGTFAMPVGGGGACGSEPAAAIAGMRPGDALISIQERAMNPKMRARLARTNPLLRTYLDAGGVDLGREPRALGKRVPAARALWSANLEFRDGGRMLDAMVYVRGRPSRDRVEKIDSILRGLDFKPGSYAGRSE